MDEPITAQFHIDFRTGVLSAIGGARSCAQQRSACIALNRRRARGILEADQLSAPGEQVSVDVWEAAFARRAREWQLPLISLDQLGIFHDAEGLRSSCPELMALRTGAEACPYLDKANEVVYKLFDLREGGSLGLRLLFELNDDGGFEVRKQAAKLQDTVEKIVLLNEIGAHPTEIVGLSDDGHYLIVKQPLARPFLNFESDREKAVEFIKGTIPSGTNLREIVGVFWRAGQPWFIGDLHRRNIMRDGDGNPTIIDALVGPVPPLAEKKLSWLRDAIDDAQALREDRPLPVRKRFDDVEDGEL